MPVKHAEMRTIFQNCQKRVQIHPKLLNEMKSVYEKTCFEDFTKDFFYLIHYSLLAERSNPYAERTLEFAAKFAVGLVNPTPTVEEEETSTPEQADELNPFLLFLIDHLIQLHDAESTNIRYNCCKLMRKLLENLDPDVTISEELYCKIIKSILDNVQDRVSEVRIQAIYTAARLQDPSDPRCPILKAYLFHMEQDSNPSVRAAIVSSIAPTSRTLEPIVNRTRDVKDTVRKAAYLFLSSKISFKALTISQRIRLLKDGLNDRSDMVKKVVHENMIPAWLKTAKDLTSFLGCLDVQGDQDVAQTVLDVHFEHKSPHDVVKMITALNDQKVIPHGQLTCEQALLWKCACLFLDKQKNPIAMECLECLQPELVKFCDYMKTYILNAKNITDLDKRLEHSFISQQLLTIAKHYDLTDEAGRRCLDTLSRNLLLDSDFGAILVKPIIACYLRIHRDIELSLQNVAEFISEIRQPITTVEVEKTAEEKRQIELKVAKIRVEINVLKDELEKCVENQDFQQAQEIKEKVSSNEQLKESLQHELLPCSQEVRSEKNDPETLLKCLVLVSEMLLQANYNVITPALYTLMETLLLPGIKNEDPAVRNQAVLALGLTCLLNRTVACQHFVLFLQISQIDQVKIRATALKIITDLLLLYGVQAFEDDDKEVEDFVQEVPNTPPGLYLSHRPNTTQESQKTFTNLLYILKSQLDSEVQELRSTVAEGLGKLLFNRRVYSPPLLSHLILLWYNPATENETYLRHFLGVFLPSFAAYSRIGQKCFEEAFMSTLLTLLEAPLSSPLSQVDAYNVGKFLLHLTSSSNCRENETTIEETNIHERLAERICNEILKEPDSIDIRIWSKLSNCIELSSELHPIHKDILVLVDKCMEAVDEKQTLKRLEKFRDTINNLINRRRRDEPNAVEGHNTTDANETQNVTNRISTLDFEEGDLIVNAADATQRDDDDFTLDISTRRGRSRKK